LQEFSPPRLAELLHAVAPVRFENKAAAILARAKSAGWEQALWQHLFRAVGYKHNVPFTQTTTFAHKFTHLRGFRVFACLD
jgi:hypothetical protein